MKTLRIDEWIIREVIDTLYMARCTLLELTALDSPQEVAKKEIENESAITRRISKAIDIIQQCKEVPEPQGLDEAARESAYSVIPTWPESDIKAHIRGFKAGAKWMAGQGEVKNGQVSGHDDFINFKDGTVIDLDPAMQMNRAFKVKDGDKVIVQIRKKED